MATTVILEVQAKPGTGNDLLARFKELLPDTRSYDGCLGLDTYQDQDDPDTLVLAEKWETREKYETYFAWRQESGALDQMAGALAGEPSIRYFDLTGV